MTKGGNPIDFQGAANLGLIIGGESAPSMEQNLVPKRVAIGRVAVSGYPSSSEVKFALKVLGGSFVRQPEEDQALLIWIRKRIWRFVRLM